MKINERLLEERNRLGLNKGEMAQAGGVANSTYSNYENGNRSPDADFLAAIAKAGCDVLYIVTGVKASASGGTTNDGAGEEWRRRLLDNLGRCSEADRLFIERIIAMAAKQETNGKLKT